MENITGDDLLSLASQPLPVDFVDVGAPLHKRVWAQGLTALERSKWERSLLKKNVEKVDARRVERARGTLIARCVVKGESDRTRLYNPEDESVVEKLMKLPAAVVEPIYDLCRRLSGIGEQELADLGKLSDETPSSDSASS